MKKDLIFLLIKIKVIYLRIKYKLLNLNWRRHYVGEKLNKRKEKQDQVDIEVAVKDPHRRRHYIGICQVSSDQVKESNIYVVYNKRGVEGGLYLGLGSNYVVSVVLTIPQNTGISFFIYSVCLCIKQVPYLMLLTCILVLYIIYIFIFFNYYYFAHHNILYESL